MWVQWLWFSWQSGRFRYMRSGVRIESSVKFNNKHIYCSSLTVIRQNLRKRGRCRERKMLGEQATRKMKERKWQRERESLSAFSCRKCPSRRLHFRLEKHNQMTTRLLCVKLFSTYFLLFDRQIFFGVKRSFQKILKHVGVPIRDFIGVPEKTKRRQKNLLCF